MKEMKYTAGQASKATGVSTATITRALKSNKISGQKDSSGAWRIDPSELHRVFPLLAAATYKKEPVQGSAIGSENMVLQAELKAAREIIEFHRETIEDLRSRLDSEASERRKLTLMLTAPLGHDVVQRPWWKVW